MAIHNVLSSASSKRRTAPGAPSLMEEVLMTVLLGIFNTVRLPVKRPSGKSCWPTTYIVDEVTSALLAPPGIGMVALLSAACVGSAPLCWPVGKIVGPTEIGVTEAADPPHSGPQFST